MKAKISAGAEIDFLTKDELKGELSSHADKLTGGVHGKYFSFSGKLPLDIDAPDAGYLWSMKLVSATFDVADSLIVTVKDTQASNMIGYDDPVRTRHVYTWSSNQGMLLPTVHVFVNGTGLAANVSGMLVYEEVVVGDEWRL